MGQFFSSFCSLIHIQKVFVHLLKVLIDELIDDLRRQVDPNVQDSVFSFAFESLEQILLDITYDGMCSTKVELVPASICLAVSGPFRTNLAICKQMVNELDRKNLNLAVLFKPAHIDVVTFRDVQKDTINEEQKGLNVQELAPTKAQIEEKLSQTLIIYAFTVKLISFVLFLYLLSHSTFLKSSLFLVVHKTLIFFIKFLATFLVFRIILLVSLLIYLL